MKKDFALDKIEAYLKNELSENERAAFDAFLEKDPILKSELQFQKETVDAIRHHRKMELKQRLNNIQIDSPFMYQLPKVAIIGTFAIVSMVAGFFVFNNQTPVKNQQAVEVILDDKSSDKMKQLESEEVLDNQNQEVTTNSENEEVIAETNTKITTPAPVYPLVPSQQKTEPKEESTIDKVNKETSKTANILSSSKEESKNAFKVQETDPEKGVFDGKDKISLESIASNKKLKYQYSNGKLFLFNNTTKGREVNMEINGKNQLFLYYENDYYELNDEQFEIAEAKKVNDKILIEKLNKRKKELFND